MRIHRTWERIDGESIYRGGHPSANGGGYCQ